MVLNDIIEQAAGRHSRASDHGGEIYAKCLPFWRIFYGFSMTLIFKYQSYIQKKKKLFYPHFNFFQPSI
jgi:hypothetical protein